MSCLWSQQTFSSSLLVCLSKRLVKWTSGYSQYFIFLLCQMAFDAKQKPIRGLELTLAHWVAMVTGLRCSSSEFSLNDLCSLCDSYVLSLGYSVPSCWSGTYTLRSFQRRQASCIVIEAPEHKHCFLNICYLARLKELAPFQVTLEESNIF